jgi:hypothetical protein
MKGAPRRSAPGWPSILAGEGLRPLAFFDNRAAAPR